ncbi:MAG TPA: hypothetical protein VF701_20570 [Thermoanaerobaculia bacterium]
MRFRPLLMVTAILSSLLGAGVVYLAMSVPNDLRADALLKQARTDMTEGSLERARESLTTIVEKYPRTDAAAAATVALLSLDHREREEQGKILAYLRRQSEQQQETIATLQKGIQDLRTARVTPPPAAAAPPPAAKKAPAKKTTTKKTTPKKTTKKTTTKKRK